MNDQGTVTAPTVEPNGATVVPPAGMVRREDFSGTEMQRAGETAAAAVAEQARALVEARYLVAMRKPRDLDVVRERILREVSRPTMARSAIYRKPMGQGYVEGPSIRYVEMALRNMANVSQDTVTVYDDPQRTIVRVTVADNETNVAFSTDVRIEKTVERKDPKGRQVISSRPNSEGETTYLVVATDDELLTKVNALVSKALRNNGLRIIPGDITEDAIVKAKEVRTDVDARDPDAARKQVVDGFAAINVRPDQLKAYLECDLGMASPAQIGKLRSIYTAIRDGETTWPAVVAAKKTEADLAANGVSKAATVTDLKSRVNEKAAAGRKGAQQPLVDGDGVVHDGREPKV